MKLHLFQQYLENNIISLISVQRIRIEKNKLAFFEKKKKLF